jgi:transcription-repair coupling factor (superfamily II helicase)
LLENAVGSLKRAPPKLSLDVDIDLPGEAYFPAEYVADMRSKIDLYRRLVAISSFDELAEFESELVDRFGAPLPPARRMLALTGLRIDAAVWRIASIHREQQYLVFGYGDRGRVEHLARLNGGRLRVVDDRSAYLTLPQEFTAPDEIIGAAKSVLRPERNGGYNPPPRGR